MQAEVSNARTVFLKSDESQSYKNILEQPPMCQTFATKGVQHESTDKDPTNEKLTNFC